jgi:putative nucleotidyltransferase with HDIG domain
MDVVSQTVNEQQRADSGAANRQIRKDRLLAIVDKGLPPFPAIVLELTKVLSGSNPDIKKAGKLIRSDPSLSSQVLRLCNSPMFGLRSRVISIEQAAVLLGAERLRNLAMTCSMLAFAGNALPQAQLTSFWGHSFLAALLAEQLATYQDYFEREQAYIAGLLHDIGRLPQCMLALEEQAKNRMAPPEWPDNPTLESDYFGMDHCTAGSRMAKSWNFMPSFIDVLQNHHAPEEAIHDRVLVEVVGSIERFLLTKPKDSSAIDNDSEEKPVEEPAVDVAAYEGFRLLNNPAIIEMLNAEYERLLPLVQVGLPGLTEAKN